MGVIKGKLQEFRCTTSSEMVSAFQEPPKAYVCLQHSADATAVPVAHPAPPTAHIGEGEL